MGEFFSHVFHFVAGLKWDTWAIIGFVAQTLFFMRFFMQWLASEKAKRSVIPVSFWYFSLLGGSLLLLYAVVRRDPVFMFGQAGGLLIYARNLHLIHKGKPASSG